MCATPANVTTLSACQKSGIGTVTYSYDAAGRRLTMTAVGGAGTVSYGYDAANRLRTITQGTTTITKTPDADGRPYQLALPNSLLATYAFDAASELSSITYASGSTKVGDLSYTYDLGGRVASRGGSLFMPEMPSAVSGTAYDADNRLCAWNAASPSCTSPSITWDNNGNLLNDGTYTYSWDSRNRLKSTTNGSLSFTYDALGRRLTKLSGGTTFGWVYDFDNIVEDTQNGAISAHVLAGLDIDERFTRTPVSTGITSVYLTDLLGSTVGVSTSAGAVSTNWGYQAFGATSASGAANPNPYQFTGRERDLTSLYFNRARYYNQAWGRFISEDPIGFAGGINKYPYVGNNPINYTDPSGNFFVVDDVIEAAIAAEIVSDLITATAGTAIALDNQSSSPGDPNSGQKENDYKNYKQICNQPPPPGLCGEALRQWKLNKALACQKARKDYADKYHNGQYDPGHQMQMDQLQKQIEKLSTPPSGP